MTKIKYKSYFHYFVDCMKTFIRVLKMKSLWWLPYGVCLLRLPWPLCLWLIADRRLALVVTCNAPHGVDGVLDGQLLELLHGMEWWLLLALLRLSMALSLSVFSRLTLTSRFLIWLWNNDNSCTSYLACCQVAVRLQLCYWWLLWLSVLTVFRKQHTIHTRARLAWSVEWFVELCFLKYACMR